MAAKRKTDKPSKPAGELMSMDFHCPKCSGTELTLMRQKGKEYQRLCQSCHFSWPPEQDGVYLTARQESPGNSEP
jgi:transcription elongation factor Elf1